MKKKAIYTLIVIALLWSFFAYSIDNEFILPIPLDVFNLMIEQITTQAFYSAIFASMLRCMSGLGIAFAVALVLGLAAGLNKKIEELFSPLYLLSKSVPNISYILIALIWTNNESAVRIISFMILFPMFYSNIVSGLHSIDQDLLDAGRLYPEKWYRMILRVYLPCIESFLMASISNGIGLAFKVGVMAEILGSVSPGIGRQFQLCRINLDMTGIFAWTLWIIIILYILEFIVKKIHHRITQ